MQEQENIKITEPKNPFDKLQKDKEEMILAEKLMQSGILFTKKGREALGINLKPFVRDYPKIGRNELCPCGSEKKYKKCCG